MRKVWIKDLVVEMALKNKGVEIGVTDKNEKHIGDLVVSKTGVEWCRGKTTPGNGTKLGWDEFAALMEKSAGG